MNTDTFLALHTTTGNNSINNTATINVNYNNTGTGKGTITGLTVTVKTAADYTAQRSQANQIDLQNVLLLATSVKFTLAGQFFNLQIVNRSRYTSVVDDRFKDYYYLEVTPTEFNTTNSSPDDLLGVSDITFFPFVQDENYNYSNNNPLISNALENRTSTLAQQSDRVGSSTSPTNLVKLLAENATPAQTQDSNYSLTGWSNARYKGTATNAQNYKGIPPAVTAKAFLGELNPSSSADLLICSRSLSDRIVVELLSTGNQEIPSFEGFVKTKYQLLTNVVPGSSTIVYTINNTAVTGSLEIGSIIKVGTAAELLRITNIEPGFNRLTVTRGYLKTTALNLTQSDKITVVKPLKIFKVGTGGANIVNSTNSKVWVKESKEILVTDEYGLVYASSSLCTV